MNTRPPVYQLRCSFPAVLLVATLLILPRPTDAIGILVPRLPEFAPIQLGHAQVRVEIRENVASTRVVQDFVNPNSRQLEADFYFPVPKGANVTDFVLYINGNPMKGEVLEREKAREIYEGIVRRLNDPGLLEWVDHNLFKVRVFPVPAHGKQRIEVEFAQPLEADQGTFRYGFPLKPPKSTRSIERNPRVDVDFQVAITSTEAIRNVHSPTHNIAPDLKDPHKISFTVPPESFGPGTGDFLLFYTLSRKNIAVSLLAHRPIEGEPGFFSLMISPSEATTATTSQIQVDLPSDITFVVDTSGSMLEDNKIEQARKALTYCVKQLEPDDRFNLIRFSTEVDTFEAQPEPASPQRIEKAVAWISELQARGGTNISGALQKAFETRPRDLETTRVYTIVFLTDGLPTVGITNPDQIIKEVLHGSTSSKRFRIFTFGVGHDVNTRLLDSLADESRATSEYIRPGQDLEVPVSQFFDKISRPAMTNVSLTLPGAEVYDLYPTEMPDLFYGSQLTVFGRYKKPGPTAIRLRGNLAGSPVEYVYEKTLPAEEDQNSFVEKLWGTRKVAFLLDQIRKSGESSELKNEVIELAKKYGVVTPYTSYLVTEDTPPPPVGPPERRIGSFPPPPRPFPQSRLFGYHRESSGAGVPASASESARHNAGFSLSADSGAAAVNTAKAVRQLKEATVTDQSISDQARNAGGRTFNLRDGVWVDTRIRPGSAPAVRIRYLSDAWFQISRLSPKLREIFALGEKVRFQAGSSVIEISLEGVDSVEDSLMQKLRQSF